MEDSYTLPLNKWSIRCTNPKCGIFLEKQTFEPDVVCQRCGSRTEVNQKIIFKEDNE